jgi:hypothetical protein
LRVHCERFADSVPTWYPRPCDRGLIADRRAQSPRSSAARYLRSCGCSLIAGGPARCAAAWPGPHPRPRGRGLIASSTRSAQTAKYPRSGGPWPYHGQVIDEHMRVSWPGCPQPYGCGLIAGMSMGRSSSGPTTYPRSPDRGSIAGSWTRPRSARRIRIRGSKGRGLIAGTSLVSGLSAQLADDHSLRAVALSRGHGRDLPVHQTRRIHGLTAVVLSRGLRKRNPVCARDCIHGLAIMALLRHHRVVATEQAVRYRRFGDRGLIAGAGCGRSCRRTGGTSVAWAVVLSRAQGPAA